MADMETSPLKVMTILNSDHPEAALAVGPLNRVAQQVISIEVVPQENFQKDEPSDQIIVDGRSEYLAYLLDKMENFQPDLIVLAGCFGYSIQSAALLMAELKQIPLAVLMLEDPFAYDLAYRVQDFQYTVYVTRDTVLADHMTAEGYPAVYVATETLARELPRLVAWLDARGIRSGALGPGQWTPATLPEHCRANLLVIALSLYQNDKVGLSNRIVEKAEHTIPLDKFDWMAFVRELQEFGLFETALWILDARVASAPEVETCLAASALSFEIGLYRESAQYAIKALELDPARPDAARLYQESIFRML